MKLYIFLILIFSTFTNYALGKYNKPYIKSLLIENAEKSQYVSPALAIAVAKVESNFKSDAISNKGAIGVMQIMPRTALMEFGVKRRKLFKPEVNIKLGVKFLDSLIKKYKGDVAVALSHYNGGSAVGKWPDVKIIPATFPYVLKVLKTSKKIERRVPTLSKFESSDQTTNYRKQVNKPQKNFSEIQANVNKIDKWLEIYNNYKNKKLFHNSNLLINRNEYSYQGGGTNIHAFF